MLSEWKSKFNKVVKELKMYVRFNLIDSENDQDLEDALDYYDHDWFNNKCLSCIECNGPCIKLNND